MTYGIIKVDTVTFTDAGVDKSVTLSGLVQNPTFSGNVTVTGTLSGVTVTGTTANFTSGNFTNISGGTHTITSGVFASGSAASPSITFTGDLNTGIYSPGADQVAISTNGTRRLIILSDGKVGLGAASVLQQGSGIDGGSAAGVLELYNGGTGNTTLENTGAFPILFKTNGSERLRITSTGTVNIVGAGSAGSTQAVSFNGSAPVDSLVLTSGGLVGVGTSSPGTLVEGRITGGGGTPATSGTSQPNAVFRVSGSGTTGVLDIGCNSGAPWIQSTDRTDLSQKYSLLLNPNGGSVGIGTTSPNDRLTVSGGNVGITTPNGTACQLILDQSGQNAFSLQIPASTQRLAIRDLVANSERLAIDSSGRLLVGTSTSVTGVNQPQYAKLQVIGNTLSGARAGLIALGRSEGASTIVAGEQLGGITFGDNAAGEFAYIFGEADGTAGANDYPGRLVFSTTADGASSPTERMRIESTGRTGTYASASDGFQVSSNAAAGTTYANFVGRHDGGAPFGGTISLQIWNNGNVQNTNNSYTAISDIKLKENVVDANSQWSDIKALQVRNYNFKEGQTHTQIGLVAQEVELVSPGLVNESPDRDEDGNDLGTVTKSVNYSVLYMKAVKALQEAMERIEVLEQRLTDAGIA